MKLISELTIGAVLYTLRAAAAPAKAATSLLPDNVLVKRGGGWSTLSNRHHLWQMPREVVCTISSNYHITYEFGELRAFANGGVRTYDYTDCAHHTECYDSVSLVEGDNKLIMKFKVIDDVSRIGQQITFREILVDHAGESQEVCTTSAKWWELKTGNKDRPIGDGKEIDPIRSIQ